MLDGVGVALVTPFNDDMSVDYSALSALIDYVDGGVDYYVILGTTAETATMSAQEQREVLSFVIERVGGRKPIVVGIGGNNTMELKRKIEEFDFSGISALLNVTPYYNKPSQEGLYQHYKVIAETSPVPVILYNVPGRTGINLSASTTVRLAKEFKNIVAVKEASGSLSQVASIIKDAPSGFKVISGDDNFTPALISIGGAGVISVAVNCFPDIFHNMVHKALAYDQKGMQSDYYRLTEAVDLLFAEGNPAGAKAALAIKGVIKNNLRLPLIAASDSLMERMAAKIEEFSL